MEAWDAESRRVWDEPQLAGQEPPPFDAAEWERHARAVDEQVTLVLLLAPENVRDLARRSRVAFIQFGGYLAAPADRADPARTFEAAEEASLATRMLVDAMRADLGLGGDGQLAPRAEPRPAG